MENRLTPTEFYIEAEFLEYFTYSGFYNHDINGTSMFLNNINAKIHFKVKEDKSTCYNCQGSLTMTPWALDIEVKKGKLVKIHNCYLIHTANALYVLSQNKYSKRYVDMLSKESIELLANSDKFVDFFDQHYNGGETTTETTIRSFKENKFDYIDFSHIPKAKSQDYFNHITNKIFKAQEKQEVQEEESVDHLKQRFKSFVKNGSKEESEMKEISLRLSKLIGEEKTREFITSCYNF